MLFRSKKANELQLELNRVFGKNPLLFSVLINKLMLSEIEVYNYFHDNLSSARSVETFDEYTLFRSQYPMLKAEHSREKNISLLREQLFMESDLEVERFLQESGIEIDRLFGSKVNTSGSALVSGLFEKWKSGIKFEKFEDLIHAGMTKNA